jgi:hypothetical protein
VSPEAVALAATAHAAVNALFNVVLLAGGTAAVALIAPNLPNIIRALRG